MSRYFQLGLTFLYVLITALSFLLLLRLSGVYISYAAGYGGIAGWLFFCFSSSYWLTDVWLFFQDGIRKPVWEEEEKLQRCLQEVLQKASIDRTYRLLIEERPGLGAFAMGHHTIAVTRALLGDGTDDEIKGVLAHELGHLTDRDPMVTAAFTMAGLLPMLMKEVSKRIGRTVMGGIVIRGIRQLGLLAGIALLLAAGYLFHRLHLLSALIPVIVFILLFSILNPLFNFCNLLVSRFIEYRQDAYAHRLGYGSGLRQMLQKIAREDTRPVSLFQTLWKGSHPVIYNRIRRLERLEGLRV